MGPRLASYFADLVVEDTLVVELKACRTLAAEHVAQMLGYLRSAKREHGVLMNFGGHRFQIRKYTMSQESLDLWTDFRSSFLCLLCLFAAIQIFLTVTSPSSVAQTSGLRRGRPKGLLSISTTSFGSARKPS